MNKSHWKSLLVGSIYGAICFIISVIIIKIFPHDNSIGAFAEINLLHTIVLVSIFFVAGVLNSLLIDRLRNRVQTEENTGLVHKRERDDIEKSMKEFATELESVNKYLIQEKEAHELIKAILAESEDRLYKVIHSAPLILILFERNGSISFIDGKGLEALQKTKDELSGRRLEEIFPEVDELKKNHERALKGASFDSIMELSGKWFNFIYSSNKNSAGEVQSIIAVGTDITGMIEAQAAKLKKEQLENTLTMAGTVSHEMHQPMQVIMSNAELIEMIIENEKVEKPIKTIINCVEIMTDITNRLRKLTKVETTDYFDKSKIIDIYKS